MYSGWLLWSIKNKLTKHWQKKLLNPKHNKIKMPQSQLWKKLVNGRKHKIGDERKRQNLVIIDDSCLLLSNLTISKEKPEELNKPKVIFVKCYQLQIRQNGGSRIAVDI